MDVSRDERTAPDDGTIPSWVPDFGRTLLSAAGIDPAVVKIQLDPREPGARVSRGPRDTWTVNLGPHRLQEPAGVLRSTIAHEIAHLALGHLSWHGRLKTFWPLGIALLLPLLGTVCWLGTHQHAHWLTVAPIALNIVVLAAGLAFCAIPAIMRRHEIDADIFSAVELDTPFTDEVVDCLRRDEQTAKRPMPYLLRLHPRPEKRKAAVDERLRERRRDARGPVRPEGSCADGDGAARVGRDRAHQRKGAP